MKSVVVLCFILDLLIINVQNQSLEPDEEQCLRETGVSEALVKEAKKMITVPADNSKYKEYLSCCWKKYRYQFTDGDMQWDIIREVLKKDYNEKIAEKLISKCRNIRGVSPGDTAALVLRCLDDHAPRLSSLHHYYSGHRRL